MKHLKGNIGHGGLCSASENYRIKAPVTVRAMCRIGKLTLVTSQELLLVLKNENWNHSQKFGVMNLTIGNYSNQSAIINLYGWM